MHLDVVSENRLSTNETNQQEVRRKGRPHISVTKGPAIEILK